jgi:geranylgeranyl diphosphate synthase, type I
MEDGAAPPAALAELKARVDAALERELAAPLARLTAASEILAPVVTELQGFTADGKRIRPALLLLGFQAGGGQDLSAVEGPALALELLHTFALMHDDVIDRASTRRGRPTVHVSFAERHRRAGWIGPSDDYGEAMAILIGDLAFVQADELFLTSSVPHDALLAAFRRFTALREEVMVGQTLDLHAATSSTTDRDLALTVATLKSGRYSVARPLEVGALLAGGSDDLVEGLGAFGDPLGRAFQVRDDLLGVFGDAAVTGKSSSSDLAEGKRTVLIAEAYARVDEHGREVLDRCLGDPALTDEQAAEVRDLLTGCGARDAAESYVDASIEESRLALAALDVPAEIRSTLDDIAVWIGGRTS